MTLHTTLVRMKNGDYLWVTREYASELISNGFATPWPLPK